jgi:alkanesulfonate monooxygenase SsuD/methylene tetrahydromethanopterin reductase-like flavin-dependent oxidoreductase (luciferase family)
VSLPETTCYPRPLGHVPIVVGGSGSRTLSIAARLGDACNLPSGLDRLDERLAVLRDNLAEAGREIDVTVLDVPVIGADRAAVARSVERLRGRVSATAYARTHHAGTVRRQIERYEELAARGVSTVFVALPDLREPGDLAPLAELAAAFG